MRTENKNFTIWSKLKSIKEKVDELIEDLESSQNFQKENRGWGRSYGLGKAESPQNDIKPVILDNNELSLAAYAEEYPENWEKIAEKNSITNKK